MGVSGGPNMIEDGLVLVLDANDINSYVSGSNIWKDLSISRDDAILSNITTTNQSLALTGTGSTINVTDLINPFFTSGSKNVSLFLVSRQKQPLTTVSISTFENTYTYNSNQQNNQFNVYTFTFQQQSSSISIEGYLNTDMIITQNTSIASTMLGSSYNISIKTTNSPTSSFISQIYLYNKRLQQNDILQNYNAIKSRYGL